MGNHSYKKRKDSLETGAEPAVLRTYVENQAILEPIPLYRASKSKQTKEQGSEECLWTYIFAFLCEYCQLFLPRCEQNRIKLYYNRLQFVKETQLTLYQTQSREPTFGKNTFQENEWIWLLFEVCFILFSRRTLDFFICALQ